MGMSVGSDPVPSRRSRGATKDTISVFKSVRYTELGRVKNGTHNILLHNTRFVNKL
jgi:hypothetical protein